MGPQMPHLTKLWELNGIGLGSTGIMCEDIDNDGETEVITDSIFGDILIISGNTGEIKQREKVCDGRIADILVTDIDKDRCVELVIATWSGDVIVHKLSCGDLLKIAMPAKPLKIFSFDIDLDGIEELFVVDVSASINIIRNGKIISRISVDRPVYTLFFEDINYDGMKEIVIIHDSKISVYKLDNEHLSFLLETDFLFSPRQIILEDINGDGKSEIILSEEDNIYLLYDFLSQRYLALNAFSGEIIHFQLCDIDLDSKTEIVSLVVDKTYRKCLKLVGVDGTVKYVWKLDIDALRVYLGDLDGDGRHEFVMTDSSGAKIKCFDYIENIWCEKLLSESLLFLKLYDLNRDMKDEIILRSPERIITLSYI